MALNKLPVKREEAIVVSKEIPGLVSGYLEDFCEADIVVNSAPLNMKLDQAGMISASILGRAGEGIQEECNQKYPNGIKQGEIAITSGYRLPYSLVFHCSVQNIHKENSFMEMAELIKRCLLEADGKQITKPDRSLSLVKNIAIPLLGTGPKNFSPEICRTFYRTILAFCLGPTRSLKNAYIIVLPKNKHLIAIIQDLKPYSEFQKITYEMTYPYKWQESENDFDVIDLRNASNEYEDVKEKFLLFPPSKPKVLSIQRIQNKTLYKKYLETRCKYKMTNKSAEKELWISCSNNANNVARNGLDESNKTNSNWGNGYLFHKEANSADESVIHSGQNRIAYLCSVGIGKITDGQRNYNEDNIPQNGNTAVNNRNAPTIFAVFDKNLFYPNYLVTYQSN